MIGRGRGCLPAVTPKLLIPGGTICPTATIPTCTCASKFTSILASTPAFIVAGPALTVGEVAETDPEQGMCAERRVERALDTVMGVEGDWREIDAGESVSAGVSE